MYYGLMTQTTGSSTSQGNVTTQTTENEGIKLSLETLYLAFEELNESIESLNTRAGVGLTVLVTALTILSFRIDVEQISPFGNAWIIGLILLILSLSINSYGVLLLARAMLARSAIGAFNPRALAEEVWKKPPEDFRHQQLGTLRAAIEDRGKLMSEKASNYNNGIRFALIGISIFILLQLCSSLLQIASRYNLSQSLEKTIPSNTNAAPETAKSPLLPDKPAQVTPKGSGGKP
jgi:hypothetical protein